MSSTPLLSSSGGLPGPNAMHDHPVFLRVSHSPWHAIPQNVLVVLRGFILAYIVGVSAMLGHHKRTEESDESAWRHFFDFGLISYGMVFLYHLITFCWTYTHLYHPEPESVRGGIESWLVRLMSLPSNMGSLRKQFYFTLFYATATVFSFINTCIYWSVTRPHEGKAAIIARAAVPKVAPAVHGHVGGAPKAMHVVDGPFSDIFGEGWYKTFCIFNLYGITSAIMVLEIIFLNSAKRPQALGSHFFGLMVNAGLYLAWAACGKAWTGADAFFWLNEEEVGSKEAVTAYCMGFVLLSPIMYTLKLGFIGIREGLTRERNSHSLEELEH
ncbi:hypothetical protein HIM_09241 [Hirsutella minnesotensis 3608]|uniref:Uncharacterized protein n=1 Tax=Hirsutella minnesotensis 3608 TaxID=1043627 RepID=A0A0F7ZSH2_9HYPO|nr:hypothetical protein HIM_09241 [Hirsutella minnesotensis 3608]